MIKPISHPVIILGRTNPDTPLDPSTKHSYEPIPTKLTIIVVFFRHSEQSYRTHEAGHQRESHGHYGHVAVSYEKLARGSLSTSGEAVENADGRRHGQRQDENRDVPSGQRVDVLYLNRVRHYVRRWGSLYRSRGVAWSTVSDRVSGG